MTTRGGRVDGHRPGDGSLRTWPRVLRPAPAKPTLPTPTSRSRETAAGDTYQNLFNFLCAVPAPRGGGAGAGPRGGGPPGAGRSAGPPDRATWYAEPVKVFDNLYFVGQIRVLRVGSDHVGGDHPDRHALRLLRRRRSGRRVEEAGARSGSTIRYAVVTHPHPDHHGGAEVPPGTLQDARRHVRPGLGRHRSARRHQAGPRHDRDRRPDAHARRHDDHALRHARSHAGHPLRAHPRA